MEGIAFPGVTAPVDQDMHGHGCDDEEEQGDNIRLGDLPAETHRCAESPCVHRRFRGAYRRAALLGPCQRLNEARVIGFIGCWWIGR